MLSAQGMWRPWCPFDGLQGSVFSYKYINGCKADHNGMCINYIHSASMYIQYSCRPPTSQITPFPPDSYVYTGCCASCQVCYIVMDSLFGVVRLNGKCRPVFSCQTQRLCMDGNNGVCLQNMPPKSHWLQVGPLVLATPIQRVFPLPPSPHLKSPHDDPSFL